MTLVTTLSSDGVGFFSDFECTRGLKIEIKNPFSFVRNENTETDMWIGLEEKGINILVKRNVRKLGTVAHTLFQHSEWTGQIFPFWTFRILKKCHIPKQVNKVSGIWRSENSFLFCSSPGKLWALSVGPWPQDCFFFMLVSTTTTHFLLASQVRSQLWSQTHLSCLGLITKILDLHHLPLTAPFWRRGGLPGQVQVQGMHAAPGRCHPEISADKAQHLKTKGSHVCSTRSWCSRFSAFSLSLDCLALLCLYTSVCVHYTTMTAWTVSSTCENANPGKQNARETRRALVCTAHTPWIHCEDNSLSMKR